MKKHYHAPILSVERKRISKQLSWHCLPCSDSLSLPDHALTVGSVQTFWCFFCPFGHITTSSVFDVSILTWFHVKPVYSSYTSNDKKPKTIAAGRFSGVFSDFLGCWFLKAGKNMISVFPGTVHSQWELSTNASEVNTLLDTAVLNWSRD